MNSQTNQIATRDYLYSPGTLMKNRMPMSTVNEARSCMFPATNRPVAPGMHNPRPKEDATCQEIAEFEESRRKLISDEVRINFDDGSYVLVSGMRRERHRRMLDFLLEFAPPIALPTDSVAFFFDRRRAAESVFGDKRQFTKVEDLLEGEMKNIHIAYRRPGQLENDFDERGSSTLVQEYQRPYTPGSTPSFDTLITAYGYRLDALAGLSYVVIGAQYMKHLYGSNELKLCYAQALPVIFKMGPVAAQLARFALSNEYLGNHALHSVLNIIGASTGQSRQNSIKDLRFGKSAELLKELGINIRPNGPLSQLYVFYDSKRAKTVQSIYYR